MAVKSLKLNEPYRAPRYTRFVLPLQVITFFVAFTDIGCIYFLYLDSQSQNSRDTKDKGNLVSLEGTLCKAFWLDKNKILCEPDTLCDRSIDLPRINYAWNGKEHTYVYVAAISTTIAESHAVSFLNQNNTKI